MLVFGVMAVMLHSITKSAVALAAASVALGIIMYELGSIWAALFEVSVCSGLVTVIMISAICLSHEDKKDLPKVFKDKKRMSLLPIILIFAGIAFIAVAVWSKFALPGPNETTETAENFREIFWNQRQADIWGLMIVILTGSVAVSVLFKERD
jgi:NADH-quinone oxidoreductase subunit J